MNGIQAEIFARLLIEAARLAEETGNPFALVAKGGGRGAIFAQQEVQERPELAPVVWVYPDGTAGGPSA